MFVILDKLNGKPQLVCEIEVRLHKETEKENEIEPQGMKSHYKASQKSWQ